MEVDRQLIIQQIEAAKATVEKAKKRYYLDNFYEFNRDILKWPDIYEPLHRRVCDFITDNIKNKKILLLIPRGCFKSSIVTIGYTLFRIARNPNIRTMISNATYPMACSFLSQIKDHVSKNEEYIDIVGDLSGDADSWREDRITLARDKSYEQKEPTVTAMGMGSNFTGSHFDLAILDDMVNRENIGTREQIDKVINFYRDSLDLVDINSAGHKEIIIIGTTWHQSDLYSWIQDPETAILDDFAVMKLPAFTGEWRQGELLFPQRLSWDVMEELKRQQGSSHFSAQYLLNPVPTEDAVFKANIKRYEETDIRGLQLNKFIAVDPAISEKLEADYSAMVCVGVDKNNDWYILDVWRDRVNPKRLLDQIFYWDDKWKPMTIGIESVAFQKALQFYAYDEMKKRNHFFPIKELKHNELSKDQRIRGLEPRYEIGSILHPQKQSVPAIEFLEDELHRFPKGKHDDLCLIGSTLIKTINGDKQIKEIREGDFVLTRDGYKKVLKSWCTGKRGVISKLGITGTPKHPIITKRGVKRLQDVEVSDTIYMWNERQSCIEERSITDILIQKGDNLGFTFGDMISGKNHHFLYTVKYGLIILEKFLLGIASTTKMRTHSITRFQIWDLLANTITQANTLLNHTGVKCQRKISKLPVSLRRNGMVVQKEYFGIANMPLKWDLENVYNLLVKDSHEFFANGILVHNCDSLASILEIASPPRSLEKRSVRKKGGHYPA